MTEPITLCTILSAARPASSHTLSEGCRAESPATKTRPSLGMTAEDCGIACAVSQSGRYSHVHVTISHPQTRAVLSIDEEKVNVISTANEDKKQTVGQNAPELLSQTVPLQRKYSAVPSPNTHGMT